MNQVIAMRAFDDWYNAIDPDERPDHTDAQEAFNAGMTLAARVCNDKAIKVHNRAKAPYFDCAAAILSARDGAFPRG